ncbi:hypothetical protein [Nitrospira sp. Nam80]
MRVWSRWSLALIMATFFLGCTTDLHRVYTDGSFRAIPGERTGVFVWAEDAVLRETVQTWLRNQGLAILDRALPGQGAESCQDCQLQAVLAHAKLLKAEQVVFARFSRNHNPDELAVSIRALSVQKEEELWKGTARESFPTDIAGEQLRTNLVLLTCHALATVWRYRPAGYLRTASMDYCYYHL